MSDAYNPTEVARLIDRSRTRYAKYGVVGTADALDMADQLEAAGARLAALEHELATLRASVVDAMSSAGPEVAEDERSG